MTINVITNIRHAGLARLYATDSTRGLQAAQVARIRRFLTILESAARPDDVAAAATPGMRFHPLQGDYAGFYSMSVSGNWRIVFRFSGTDVTDVDLVDYH